MAKGKEKLQSLPVVGQLLRKNSSDSADSHSSQLVDLIVEDHEAEQVERVRARKEGGPGWNSVEQKHFVKTFPDDDEAEEVRQGFNPDRPEKKTVDENHALIEPSDATVGVSDEEGTDQLGRGQPWEERDYEGTFDAEREVWGGDKK